MKYGKALTYIILLFCLFPGCQNEIRLNSIFENYDPDIIYTGNDEVKYFKFQVIKTQSTNSEQKESKYIAHVVLLNPLNEIIYDGITDDSGNIIIYMDNNTKYESGFYCLFADIKDEKYNIISDFGKLVFYYTGYYSINKDIFTYSIN